MAESIGFRRWERGASQVRRNRLIREAAATGRPYTEIATTFGVSRALVANIVEPGKSRSRAIFNKAVSQGLLRRAETCERCGAASATEGHHADYAKPLEVEWLCVPCHKDEHRHDRRRRSIRPPHALPAGAKLTPEQVREVRAAKGRVTDVAARYGISRSQVYRIRSGESWGSVT